MAPHKSGAGKAAKDPRDAELDALKAQLAAAENRADEAERAVTGARGPIDEWPTMVYALDAKGKTLQRVVADPSALAKLQRDQPALVWVDSPDDVKAPRKGRALAEWKAPPKSNNSDDA